VSAQSVQSARINTDCAHSCGSHLGLMERRWRSGCEAAPPWYPETRPAYALAAARMKSVRSRQRRQRLATKHNRDEQMLMRSPLGKSNLIVVSSAEAKTALSVSKTIWTQWNNSAHL
jgi:hypothetical protein